MNIYKMFLISEENVSFVKFSISYLEGDNIFSFHFKLFTILHWYFDSTASDYIGMINFDDASFNIGISHSARGYCINMVLETMKTYSSDDCLTEEAVVAKLRTCRYHHLFLHTSLRRNSCGLYFLILFLYFCIINIRLNFVTSLWWLYVRHGKADIIIFSYTLLYLYLSVLADYVLLLIVYLPVRVDSCVA
jgi:hypothetical protein